jgi:hypothetical protein
VTSCKFSLNGKGTFLPLDLSGSSSTLQYQSTLCATDANSLHFLIKKLCESKLSYIFILLLNLVVAVISQRLEHLWQILKDLLGLDKLKRFEGELVQEVLTVVLEAKELEKIDEVPTPPLRDYRLDVFKLSFQLSL